MYFLSTLIALNPKWVPRLKDFKFLISTEFNQIKLISVPYKIIRKPGEIEVF